MQVSKLGQTRQAQDGSVIQDNVLAMVMNPYQVNRGPARTGGPQFVGSASCASNGSLPAAKKAHASAAPTSSDCGMMKYIFIGAVILVVAAIAGIVGWQLSAGDEPGGGDGDLSAP